MNKSLVVSVVLLVLVGVGVSRVKYEVVFLRKTLKTVNSEIEKCNDSIKVLNAEWNYLNTPERLKKLAAKHLPDMRPIGVKQVVVYNKVIKGDLVAIEEEQKEQSSFSSLLDSAIGGN